MAQCACPRAPASRRSLVSPYLPRSDPCGSLRISTTILDDTLVTINALRLQIRTHRSLPESARRPEEAAGSSPLRPSTRQHHTTIDDQYNRIYVTTPSTTPSPTGGGRRPTSVHHHSIKRNLPTHPPFRESWVRGVGTRFSLRTRYGVRGLKFVIVSTAADWSADQTYLITYGLIGHRMLAPW